MTVTISGSGNSYASINAAVADAVDGDIIEISGTYTEQVVIDGKTNLTLKGIGNASIVAPADVTQTATSSSSRAIDAVVTVKNSTSIVLDGIDVNGGGAGNSVDPTPANFVGVMFRNSSGELLNVDITGVHDAYPGGTTADHFPVQSGNQRGVGLQVDNDTLMSFTMTGGSISDFQKNAAVFNGAILDVSGVTVTGGGAQTINAQNGFQVLNSTGSIHDNVISAIGYAGSGNWYSCGILAYGNTDLDLTDNVIVGTNGATLDSKVVGIYVYAPSNPNVGGEIAGNTISWVDAGINVYDEFSTSGIHIHDNTVTDLDLSDPYVAGIEFDPDETSTVPFVVNGSDQDDILRGGAGTDSLSGLGGDDILDGRGGNDALDGGDGTDTVDMTGAGTGGALVDLASGIAFSTDTGVDTLSNIENMRGSDGTDSLNGDDGDNVIYATTGDDIIDGRGGSDTYDLFDAAVPVMVDLSPTAGSASGGGFETATLKNIENVIAGSGGDTIIQAAGVNNSIDGGGGIDTVSGYPSASMLAFANGRWTVTTPDGDVDTLTNVERVVIGNQICLLVDQTGSGYGTVQSAVNAAQNGDKIIVSAGTFNEHVVVDKDVTIEGANAGVSGSCPRGDETIITWSSAETILLKSDGISLDGLKVVNTGGNDGISIYTGTVNNPTNLLITNNVVEVNGTGWGVDLYNQGNSTVTFNTVTNNLISGGDSADSKGIVVYNESYADISGNTITGVNVGIQTGNNSQALTLGAGTPNISDNLIEAGRVGIYHNLHYGTATAWIIDDNTVIASTGADPNDPAVTGIRIMSISSPGGATVTDNDVSGFFAGYQLWNDADGVTIEGGCISGNTYGVEALHIHPTYGAAKPGTADGYAIDGVTFDNNGTDVRAENTDVSAIGDPSNITTVFIEEKGTFDAGNTAGPISVRSTGDIAPAANATIATLLDGDSNIQTFDDMDLGAITDGENGWRVLSTGKDQTVVDDGTGNHVFRISSDPSSGDFGGPYSPALSVAAGEAAANAAYQSQLISFDFKAVNDDPNDLSRIEVDFANEAGNDRNNFLVMETTATGIRIAVSEPDLNGDFSADNPSAPFPNDWRELISGVDASIKHHLEMRLDYVDGPNNDVIGIYLDGVRIGITTTFENYHDALGGTHDSNAAANLTNRIIFRGSNNGQPTDGADGQNRGFDFDNLTSAVYNNTNATGNDQDNVITGNSGNNTIDGKGGSDIIDGGNNGITGDTAVYDKSWSSYTITKQGSAYKIRDNANGDTDTVTNVENFKFGDRTFTDVANHENDFITRTPPPPPPPSNTAPTLTLANEDVAVQAGTTLDVTIGDGHFTDPEGTDLNYSITVNGSGEIPSWISFNVATGAFSAKPTTANVGAYVVVVTASDGSLTRSDAFDLVVTNPANPSAEITLSAQSVAENSDGGTVVGDLSGVDDEGDALVSFALTSNPDGAFAIVDGALVVSADAELDFETKASYAVSVTGTDSEGDTFEKAFTISITDVREDPKGTRHNDKLVGDAFGNIMDGKQGKDLLTGNDGADTFVLGKHYGRDRTDFSIEDGDLIDLSAAKGIKGFGDLMAHHIKDTDAGLVILANDNSTLFLKGIDAGDLTSDMFMF